MGGLPAPAPPDRHAKTTLHPLIQPAHRILTIDNLASRVNHASRLQASYFFFNLLEHLQSQMSDHWLEVAVLMQQPIAVSDAEGANDQVNGLARG